MPNCWVRGTFHKSEELEISLVSIILTAAYRPRSTVDTRYGVRIDDELDFRYLT